MNEFTHVVIVNEGGVRSSWPIIYDGEKNPTAAQVRTACGLGRDVEFELIDLRRQKGIWISATGGPNGLQHCSMRDLGWQLDFSTTDRFSGIYRVSDDLLSGVTPDPNWLSVACDELRMVEETDEMLPEDATLAHALASELERRFGRIKATV
jgi:hypothetical protein